MVRAQLRRLSRGDEAAADDLAQETFMLAWRNLDKFRGEARFSSWLYRIAYTCFLQANRTPMRHDPLNDETMEQLQAPIHAADLQLDLERAMRQLSEAEQVVLLHCAQMGLSHEEAAYVLGMPLGTVKTHATRGKAKLKAWLSDWRDASMKEIS
ncbi:sigma-70 family RNA polymerase sigma factor [Dyella jejuensis]|uniref:RNA polymerase sigma factor n=2 Tax=Dyella jejuensis TaxID=1432009 RepID=A0ABW8JKE4_9GAMM